jgi:tartrate dehydratase alpha subunit/fumarate hydratase class I-like protein
MAGLKWTTQDVIEQFRQAMEETTTVQRNELFANLVNRARGSQSTGNAIPPQITNQPAEGNTLNA